MNAKLKEEREQQKAVEQKVDKLQKQLFKK